MYVSKREKYIYIEKYRRLNKKDLTNAFRLEGMEVIQKKSRIVREL